MLTLAFILILAAQSSAPAPAGFVLADDETFPPRGAAWIGAAPHNFLNGQITLFCGSHGVFSKGSELPQMRGGTAVISYNAEFRGELKVTDSALPFAGNWTIRDPIRITERITALGGRKLGRHFATELLAIEFTGADFPPHVSIRESAARRSAGTMTIDPDNKGGYRIRSLYQVWLDITVDGGRTWHQANNAVAMRLAPESRPTMLSAPLRDNR